MKKNLLVLVVFLVTLTGYAQKKQQENLLDLSQGKIENCTIEGGKSVTSFHHSARLYLPVESFESTKGLKVNYSNFEQLGESSENRGSVNVIYTDDDGNEKKATWSFWRSGNKNIYFNAFQIDSKGTTVEIDPALIKEIYLGFGKNKKVDVTVSVIK